MARDRRIPRIIEEFVQGSEIKDILSFLAFRDWFESEEWKAADWIVVARSWRNDATRLFTFSALADASESNLDKILSLPRWEVRQGFGKPDFWTGGAGDEIHYDPGERAEIAGIEFRPFVILRSFHGYVPWTFELVQNFLLYHEAFFVRERNEYQRIDDDGEIHTIVEIVRSDDNLLIRVDTHHLRDYLAANRCYLVRYHDHTRRSIDSIEAHITDEFQNYILREADFCYDLWLRTDIVTNEFKSHSRLLGKDIIHPYAEPDRRHTWFATGDRGRKFVQFIIGRNEDGSLIESTCDEDELSNYFVDRGTPHSLTPVFFRREVLAKYYQEPTKYRVNGSYVGCLDLWGVSIDVTAENLVQAWLGDLGRLPYKEQLHWREFNVPPRGTITSHRWRRDFLAQWAEPETDPVYYFHRSFEQLLDGSTLRFGTPLFLRLKEADQHAYHAIRIPLTDEWKEFDEIIQALAKVLCDSLDVNLLTEITGLKIDGENIKGSIDLLEVFLQAGIADSSTIARVVRPFRAIQALRSTGAAHRKGKKFDQVLLRYGIAYMSKESAISKLITDATWSLEAIRALLV